MCLLTEDNDNPIIMLESATSKEENIDIIIDATVYEKIHSKLQSLPWVELKVEAKGFDDKIKVYGLDFQSIIEANITT